MYKEGKRPVAFSQELLKWAGGSTFEAGDVVYLRSSDYPDDPRCNGIKIVSDALNARYRHRGDLFFIGRKNNISCHADVYLKKRNDQ